MKKKQNCVPVNLIFSLDAIELMLVMKQTITISSLVSLSSLIC